MLKNILAIVVAAAVFLSCACAPNREPPRLDRAWSAECSVGVGSDRMWLVGQAAVTFSAYRPMVIKFSPQLLDMGGNALVFVARHEFLHTIGWHGHPYSDPEDDVVVYMDRAIPVRFSPEHPDFDPLAELPEPSELEADYLRQCPATIWISLPADEPALIDAILDAAKFWNEVAGHEVFRIRASPATMRQ